MSASKRGCAARLKFFARRYRADDIEMRFDIVAVDASGKRLEIELLRNAF
jgi:Holliday junction resolvase-like predicted endonuclease